MIGGFTVSALCEEFVLTLATAVCIINPFLGFGTFVVGSVASFVAGSWLGDKLNDLVYGLFDWFKDAGSMTMRVDPIILDLDNNGVETTSLSNGVYFDFDSNGFKEKIGWVGGNDGLLVHDINNNGKIDNGSELFGNETILTNGKVAANGFEALKNYDDNMDGAIDSRDSIYSEVINCEKLCVHAYDQQNCCYPKLSFVSPLVPITITLFRVKKSW